MRPGFFLKKTRRSIIEKFFNVKGEAGFHPRTVRFVITKSPHGNRAAFVIFSNQSAFNPNVGAVLSCFKAALFGQLKGIKNLVRVRGAAFKGANFKFYGHGLSHHCFKVIG